MTTYLKFWNITQPAFSRPRSAFYSTPRLAPLLQRLEAFCQQQQSCAVVVGDSGCGKSTMARWLHQTLNIDSHEVILTALSRKERTSGWLLPRLAELLGVRKASASGLASASAEEHYQLTQRTIAALDGIRQEGRRLIVIIDAAHQAVTPEAFDDIISLLNAESLSGDAGCLSFVLMGLPSLSAVVAQTPELATRVTMTLNLEHFTREECGGYVQWCLEQAGIREPIFNEGALDTAHMATQGAPSALNALCENALMELANRHERRANHGLMSMVIRQMHGENVAILPLTPPSPSLAPPADVAPAAVSVATLLDQGAKDAKETKETKTAPSKREEAPKSGRQQGRPAPSAKNTAKNPPKGSSSGKKSSSTRPADAKESPEREDGEATSKDPASIRLTSLFKSETK